MKATPKSNTNLHPLKSRGVSQTEPTSSSPWSKDLGKNTKRRWRCQLPFSRPGPGRAIICPMPRNLHKLETAAFAHEDDNVQCLFLVTGHLGCCTLPHLVKILFADSLLDHLRIQWTTGERACYTMPHCMSRMDGSTIDQTM
jgi:hypothetical protein